MKTFDEAMELLFNTSLVFLEDIMERQQFDKNIFDVDYGPSHMLYEFDYETGFHLHPMIEVIAFIFEVKTFAVANILDTMLMEKINDKY